MTRKKSQSLLFGLKKIRFQRISFPGQIWWPEKGGISILFSLFAFLALVVLAFVSSSMVTVGSRSAASFAEDTQAQYLTEAGVEYGLKLTFEGQSLPYAEIVSLYGGEFRLAIVDLGSYIQLMSIGIFDDAKKTVQVLIAPDDYTIDSAASSGNDVKFEEGSGTITGGLHGNNTVVVNPPHIVTGPIVVAPPILPPPLVNWNFFKDRAIALGQYVVGDKTFTAAGSPYTGVWYVTEVAEFELNAVLNGTIVADNDVKFEGNNVAITATPRTMPAVVAGNRVTSVANNITMKGLVYCGNGFECHGNDLTIQGALIAVNTLSAKGFDKDIAFDPNYASNVRGLGKPGSVQIWSWKEL